ncbi:nucleoside diphosphate-linked moiety X motif 8 isoform X2 [Odontomachus brunneus]|uniref:nucleoside diphosphate-linked moiety X motif 8 isoform X2 n=1 Tax=Odontomachus brunneus TaxID=486640 RepID=UPI0013F233D4|nr:nucleoside diphosphate-linked moiety X motif 8 isoform X2 [Odontomachus brunneus]XP_032674685.1 nucleoside diphosphate-linked moiety X motif 8 isoform X2 [Odontomachus brunneus]
MHRIRPLNNLQFTLQSALFMKSVKYKQVNMNNPRLKAEVVLSESNRKVCIEKLRSYQLPSVQETVPEAAVLVPLCMHNGELGLLYTLRSMKLTTNRGQVSFPGGKRDKEDSDLIETALRETWEELKISRDKIDVWTEGNMIGKTTVNVMPVLAYIGEIVVEDLEINQDEVEEAFVISLQKLCDPELFRFTRFRNINLPTYLGGKHRVWGFTGAITHVVLECLVPNVYKNVFRFYQLRETKASDILHAESQKMKVERKSANQKNTLSKI